eukprot:PhM_4_TR19057/c0_g1_i2/m.3451
MSASPTNNINYNNSEPISMQPLPEPIGVLPITTTTTATTTTTTTGAIMQPHPPVTRLEDAEACWICLSNNNSVDLFRPCACNSFVHRKCLATWRFTGRNLRSWSHCPNCASPYRIVYGRTATPEQAAECRRRKRSARALYYRAVLMLWLTLLLSICGTIAVFAAIAYGIDGDSKNIPVFVKYCMTSVAAGVPSTEDVEKWRDDFNDAETAVWPYYTLFGSLCTSVVVLIVFHVLGLSDREEHNEEDRPRRERRPCCTCCRGHTHYHYDAIWWYCYFPNVYCDCNDCCCGASIGDINPATTCQACGDNCAGCCEGIGCKDCADTCRVDSCGGCHNPCGDGGGSGGGDGGVLIIVFVVAIIVLALIILISALFVIILFVVKRIGTMYGAYTSRLMAMTEDRTGYSRVLDRDEQMAPHELTTTTVVAPPSGQQQQQQQQPTVKPSQESMV